MTEAAITDPVDKKPEAEQQAKEGQGDAPDRSAADKGKASDVTSEAAKGAAGQDDKKGESEKSGEKDADKEIKSTLPDDWRELASAGDEDALKLLKRYGSLNGVVKALIEKDKLIRSGKIRKDMPDAKDEAAMAEWRKNEGIPADATGYVFPDDVKKRMTDEDKPLLSSFTEFAHKHNARPDVVEIASRWYFDMVEGIQAKNLEADAAAEEEAEESLRKEWSGGEYKTNLNLGKRFIESIPGVGEQWTEARMPNGRRLGDIPEFVKWASDMGREQFGDLAFATGDAERKHVARKEEIEKIRNTDFERYEREGLDKEYRKIIEKELARPKR